MTYAQELGLFLSQRKNPFPGNQCLSRKGRREFVTQLVVSDDTVAVSSNGTFLVDRNLKMADNAVSSNGTFLMDRNLKMEDNAVNSSGTFLVDLNLKMEDNAASDAGSPSSSCRPLINQQTTDNGGNKHKGNGNKKKQDGKFWLKFVIIFGMLDLMLISAIVIIHYPNVWPNYSKTDQVPTPLVDFRLPCHAAADDTDGDRRDAWCVGEEATLSDTLIKVTCTCASKPVKMFKRKTQWFPVSLFAAT